MHGSVINIFFASNILDKKYAIRLELGKTNRPKIDGCGCCRRFSLHLFAMAASHLHDLQSTNICRLIQAKNNGSYQKGPAAKECDRPNYLNFLSRQPIISSFDLMCLTDVMPLNEMWNVNEIRMLVACTLSMWACERVSVRVWEHKNVGLIKSMWQFRTAE